MLPEPRNGTLPAGNPAPVTIVGSVTHPAGATATYTLDIREFFRSEVAVVCNNFNLTSAALSPVQEDDTPLYPLNWHDWSLTSKYAARPRVCRCRTGPTATTADRAHLPLLGPVPLESYGNLPTCPAGTDCSLPRCASASCADRSYTLVTAPDQTKERFSFGNTWQYDEGKLLKVQRGYNPATGRPPWRPIDHTYDLYHRAPIRPIPSGSAPVSAAALTASPPNTTARRLSKVTSRDGATFSWAVGVRQREMLRGHWHGPRSVSEVQLARLQQDRVVCLCHETPRSGCWASSQATYVNGVETARASVSTIRLTRR
jgi:hypothetical protein